MDKNNTSGNVFATVASFVPPTPLLNDYLKIGILSFILAFGGPLNGYALWQQCYEYRKALRMRKKDSESSYLLQKIHLNLANLLLNLSYCIGFISWHISYSWYGGDFLCRFCHMLWNTTLYASSFMVAVIAIDRLKTLIKIEHARNGEAIDKLLANGKSVIRPTKVMVLFAWILSILISLPQLAVFQVITLSPEYSQCTTIWSIQRYNRGNSTQETFSFSKVYLSFHIITIFWIPLIVISLCYCLIMLKELRHSRQCQDNQDSVKTRQQHNGRHISIPNSNSGASLTRNNPTSSIPKSLPLSSNSSRVECRQQTIEMSNKQKLSKSKCNAAMQVLVVSGRKISNVVLNSRPILENIGLAMKFEAKEIIDKYRKQRNSTDTEWKAQKLSRKLLRSSLLIVCAYVVLWLPYNSLTLIALFDPVKFMWVNKHLDWLTSMILFNTIVNPFFYSFENLKKFLVILKNSKRSSAVLV